MFNYRKITVFFLQKYQTLCFNQLNSVWKWKSLGRVRLCARRTNYNYTVRGILQARILKQVAFPFSRGSSQSRDPSQVSHIVGGFFTSWTKYCMYVCIYIYIYTPGVGDGQGGLVCCNSWGGKESDTTERLNWNENKKECITFWRLYYYILRGLVGKGKEHRCVVEISDYIQSAPNTGVS